MRLLAIPACVLLTAGCVAGGGGYYPLAPYGSYYSAPYVVPYAGGHYGGYSGGYNGHYNGHYNDHHNGHGGDGRRGAGPSNHRR